MVYLCFDGTAEAAEIRDELERRKIEYQIAPDKPAGLEIGDTYLSGKREVSAFYFNLLDQGYRYDAAGKPVPRDLEDRTRRK